MKIIQLIKQWIYSFSIISNELEQNKKSTFESDSVRQKKDVMSQIQVGSMMAHESDCDIFLCKGNCFKRLPDKIVSKVYKVDKKTRKKIKL